MEKKALYLAGGGARGAYQVGVLKAIDEILKVKVFPFDMLCGVSVGSVNATVLASYAHDFPEAVKRLETLWGAIHCDQVFDVSNYQLGKSVLRNISHLIVRQNHSGYLLDTSPLRELIHREGDFYLINNNIAQGHLETLEVQCSCYENAQTVSFYQQKQSFEDWFYPRHMSKFSKITADHIMASSALPLFFPPVKVGQFHYGDGSLGLVAPLRGCIRFNMNRIMILGTRQAPSFAEAELVEAHKIDFAQILGAMMNGLFIDNLDRDIELVNRMNDIARLLTLWRKHQSPWRPIQTLYLRPSMDMGAIAQAQYQSMPALLRFLLNMLGAKAKSGDLLSFLLFESEFTSEIVKMGYKDTMEQANVVAAFFK
ncbi:patatin-like phospholipase family protein [Legionella sp. W05-934-2]|jgi:NTE family protein|uniref:patatin-like phospholipase family protein n=1 Tax=Legionella sp. W05-934-2 TaxID=1198649 RepID=UPI003461B83C